MRRGAIFFAALGAGLMYFFDPELGRTRRARFGARLAARARRTSREVGRKAEYTRGHVRGLRHEIASHDTPPPTDAALKDKVESEVLSRWRFPTGQIAVNAVDGVVYLRGLCETADQIQDLEQQVRKVTGVIDVVNYMHLPDTPAPNKKGAIR
jgi:osmotically-inducible protein OsmY